MMRISLKTLPKINRNLLEVSIPTITIVEEEKTVITAVAGQGADQKETPLKSMSFSLIHKKSLAGWENPKEDNQKALTWVKK